MQLLAANSIGYGDVSQQTVDLTVQELIERTSPAYSTLADGVVKVLEGSPDYYSAERANPCMTSTAGFIHIPQEYVKSTLSGEQRYSVRLFYHIKELDEAEPIGSLVVPLSKRITALGFPCRNVEIRFEKGCLDPLTPYWHVDGPRIHSSVVICFGTKAKWSTWLLDEKNNQEVFGPNCNPSNFTELANSRATALKIESLAQPAKFGYLYNAAKVLHRSPTKEDLRDEPLSPSDYRLFLRFAEEQWLSAKL
jgi:hypothetical protein